VEVQLPVGLDYVSCATITIWNAGRLGVIARAAPATGAAAGAIVVAREVKFELNGCIASRAFGSVKVDVHSI